MINPIADRFASKIGAGLRLAYRCLPGILARWSAGTAIARRFVARAARRYRPSEFRSAWEVFRTVDLADLLRGSSDSRSRSSMSRPMLALNLCMIGLSVFFSIRVGHTLFTPDLQSPIGIGRPVAAAVGAAKHNVTPNSRSRRAHDLIVTRNLFHPNRSEPTRSNTQLSSAPALTLYGVVISNDIRLAYLQDPATKHIFGYTTGDTVAGGRVARIESDRVVIMWADGPLEVVLHRPKEPLPVALTPAEVSPHRSRGRQE